MEYLKNIMSNLPNNLEYLTLDLNSNYLGRNSENL